MERTNLSFLTLQNSIYSFIGFIWPVLIYFVLTPLMIHKLGAAQYGLYVLLIALGGFVSLLDFGYTNATHKYLAELFGLKRKELVTDLVATSNTVFALLGVVFFMIFIFTGILLDIYYPAYFGEIGQVRVIFFWAGLELFFSFLAKSYGAVLFAKQRYDLVTKINVVALAIMFVFIWNLLQAGFQLEQIIMTQAIFGGFLIFIFYFYANRIAEGITYRLGFVRERILQNFQYGVYVFMSNVGLSIFNQMDRLIIPLYANPTSLAYYSLPGNLASRSSGMVASFTNILFHLTSGLFGMGEIEKIRKIYIRSSRLITILAAGMTLVLAIYASKILRFWIDEDFAKNGSTIFIILSFTFFLITILSPLTQCLYGVGKSKFLAICSVFLALVNVCLLFILLPKFGIIGAAWAYLGAAMGIIPIILIAEKRILNLSERFRDYLFLYGKILITAFITYIITEVFFLSLVTNLVRLVFFGSLSMGVYFAGYWLFGFFAKEDVELFRTYVSQIFKFKYNERNEH